MQQQPLRPSHSQSKGRVVAAWFEALGLSARSTYHGTQVLPQDALWTRMALARPSSRAQIDFLLASAGVSGHAKAHSMQGRFFQRSDHRLVAGKFVFPCAAPIVAEKWQSLTGLTIGRSNYA